MSLCLGLQLACGGSLAPLEATDCGRFVSVVFRTMQGLRFACVCVCAVKDVVVGIDLGTTYSCVGVYRQGRVDIIANDQGNRITPSYVAFTDEERKIGEAAKNEAASNPTNTIFDVKRLIGRRFNEKEVQRDKELLPYEIINKDGKPYIRVTVKGQKKELAPEEVSAMVLGKMKEVAENYLGREVKNAVVTVPGGDSERATLE